MTTVVTGSAGHLGEALVRTIRGAGGEVLGADIKASPTTDAVGSIVDRGFVRACLAGADAIIHAATLHKPHVATHSRQDFVDTNITGTLSLLEEAVAHGVPRFVFTSTTSAFGAALTPAKGEPAAWITEEVTSVPRNIYGVTKAAAEDLCQVFHRRDALPCLILRTSRFFPEEDDSAAMRTAYADANAKANEFLFRRVDIEDAVTAHLNAVTQAERIGFGRYIISATTPFTTDDLPALRNDAPTVVAAKFRDYPALYESRGWQMFSGLDRVYVNAKARTELDWTPQYDFERILAQLAADEPIGSALARDIGSKGYHGEAFAEGPYPVE